MSTRHHMHVRYPLQTDELPRCYVTLVMKRLLSITLLTVLASAATLLLQTVPVRASESKINVTVRITPYRTVVVDESDEIILISNPTIETAAETQVRRTYIHGERLDMTPEIQEQYDEIAALHDLSAPGTVYESESSLLTQAYNAIIGYFHNLFSG